MFPSGGGGWCEGSSKKVKRRISSRSRTHLANTAFVSSQLSFAFFFTAHIWSSKDPWFAMFGLSKMDTNSIWSTIKNSILKDEIKQAWRAPRLFAWFFSTQNVQFSHLNEQSVLIMYNFCVQSERSQNFLCDNNEQNFFKSKIKNFIEISWRWITLCYAF